MTRLLALWPSSLRPFGRPPCGYQRAMKPGQRDRMDACLTQEIPVSLPLWRKYSAAPKIPGYSSITSITPLLTEFLGSKPESEGQLNSDNLFIRLLQFEGSGSCQVEVIGKKKKKAFCKVAHLLDPIRSIQAYYEDPVKGKIRELKKLENPMNKSYVDSLAAYLLGQLRERNVSPHFCLYFGGFRAVADVYRYNITEEFDSYRKYRAFWEKRRRGLFELHMERDNSSDSESDSDESESLSWILKTPKSSLRSTPLSYKTPSSCKSDKSHISLNDNIEGDVELELQSVHSFESAEEKKKDDEDENAKDEDVEEDDESGENNISVFSQFKNYPVVLIFQEEMEGVLEDLLDDEEKAGAEKGTPEWEARWTAWTFQIIAALCAAQGVLGFTHNDLHTNNIAWTATTEPWLWYKARDGTMWRVPTFGKLLRIIDFGRAIYRVGEKWFVSDDYETGGDAEGQYRFGPLLKAPQGKQIYPNPSFDLCRYAVSVINDIFSNSMPVEHLDGEILSEEDGWVVHETESPLWNLLWSWTVDDHRRNVLRDEDGTERYPDFDLYKHISAHVFGAKPQEQLRRKIFEQYLIHAKDVGEWETVYPLFC